MIFTRKTCLNKNRIMIFTDMIYVTIIIQILCLETNAQVVKCGSKPINQIDKSIAKLIVVGQKNSKFPTNAQQLRPYCNLALKTFEKINEFSDRCVSKVGRDTMKVLTHPIGVELKSVCKPGKLNRKAQELLSAAVCANAGLKNWERCMLEIVEKYTGLLNAPEKLRIPMACCGYHRLEKCLIDEAEEVKQCTRKTFDFVIKYVHKIIDPILTLMCSEYSEPSDRCDKMIESIPKRTSRQPKYKTIVIPLIELTMGLGDGDGSQ